MRVLIVDTCYPAFLADHYASRPGLAEKPYDVQWRLLMDAFFGTADGYSHYLGELGHTAHEVVVNCAPLQEAWVREQGARIVPGLPGFLRQQEIVLAQARWFEPDVVYVQNVRWVLEPTLLRLGRCARMLVAQVGSKPPRTRKLQRYNLVVTSFPHFVDRFRRAGVRCTYLRIGFDVRVLERLKAEGARFATRDAVFVGTLKRTQHQIGNAALSEASERTQLEVWGYGLEGWSADSPIRRAYRGEAWGLDMYRLLRSARIAVNRHGEIAEDYANNMRLFEATGVGSMLLTDAKRNLGDLFEPGSEVATYTSGDDLSDKIAHYLEHEDERAAIAAAGHRRTLAEHTYRHRMEELADLLDREICRKQR
jgi:spore maturation protein CgeB